jgi:hypothetical protein
MQVMNQKLDNNSMYDARSSTHRTIKSSKHVDEKLVETAAVFLWRMSGAAETLVEADLKS